MITPVPAPVELGDVAGDGRIELQLSPIHEQHERRGGRDDLGHGRHVVERAVGIGLRARRRPREVTVALRKQNRIVAPDDQCRSRVRALLDPSHHQRIERRPVETRWQEGTRRSDLHRKQQR